MITYRHDLDELDEAALVGFFEGWPTPPTPATHLRILQGSDVVVIALDDGSVVGFATGLTDGVLSAYIPLLEVRPAYRGRGIGVELVRRLMAQLEGLYMVDTCCDEELAGFYEQVGMRRALAMVRRDHAAQAGLPAP